MRIQHIILAFFFLFLFVATQTGLAADPGKLIDYGGYAVELNGHTVASLRANECFVPASTIKVLSALTILRTLGENFRFATQFYYNADTSVLTIKGSGDPFLTSEVLAKAAARLREKGLRRVTKLVLDDSAFALARELPDGSENSRQPYDTGNGALAVNFNTVAFRKDAQGQIFQDDPNTPLLPITRELAASAPGGSQRVNVYSGGVVTVSPALRHSAELLITLLRQAGIECANSARRGRVAATSRLILTVDSELTSREMVRSFLLHSTNFVTNQLVLAAAGERFGRPANWFKAKMLLESTAYQYLGLTPADLQIQEGSGLSRRTCASPKAMLTILRAFAPWKELLPEKFGALVKTGTMTGVYCLIGYKDTPRGLARFAILLNQERNRRKEVLNTLFAPPHTAPTAVTRTKKPPTKAVSGKKNVGKKGGGKKKKPR
ncbi:MAG: D-alanyl-D-alanine carboxypeptidase [Desulfobulbaceae bacterium]|jgi:D-alanyl-D-alanine carboxypeptidase/D-alanyl-D-alanine-endopeptidase (penicillin-binding protein 4)|nr:D-alanyl-D-alanine carboxypeptidase [Desulfobulbaceae bacterium]